MPLTVLWFRLDAERVERPDVVLRKHDEDTLGASSQAVKVSAGGDRLAEGADCALIARDGSRGSATGEEGTSGRWADPSTGIGASFLKFGDEVSLCFHRYGIRSRTHLVFAISSAVRTRGTVLGRNFWGVAAVK